jgi:hypothetical protein
MLADLATVPLTLYIRVLVQYNIAQGEEGMLFC